MKVDVYRNLTKKCWSIRHKGKVIAHAKGLYGKDCEMIVSEKGRQRALREYARNVHAFLRVDAEILIFPYYRVDFYDACFHNDFEFRPSHSFGTEIRYNPFIHDSFIESKSGKRLHSAGYVYLNEHSAYITQPEYK